MDKKVKFILYLSPFQKFVLIDSLQLFIIVAKCLIPTYSDLLKSKKVKKEISFARKTIDILKKL